jgi:hypothetical protein
VAAPPEAPIFVIGYQRSGTTLLQALLGAHPRIAAPPEIYFVYRVADHAEYFGDLADDSNLERALHEALNPAVDIFADCGFDEARLLERAKAGPRTYGALLDAMLSDFAERSGKQRWSEKSPGQPIDSVLELFPHAQILHIVRDPRDVVASSLRAPWTDPDAGAIARDWRAFTLRTIRRGLQLGPRQFIQLRYEDLTRDPEAVLRVVCAFLGEQYDPAMLDDPSRRRGTVPAVAADWQAQALEAVRPVSEGAWRERLSRADQARVNAVVGSVLGALGYEAPGVRERARGLVPAVGEAARRGRARLARPSPQLSPEERYRLTRAFLDRQAERVR